MRVIHATPIPIIDRTFVVNHSMDESNDICGSTALLLRNNATGLKQFLFSTYSVSLFRKPEQGTLYYCGDAACSTPGAAVNDLDPSNIVYVSSTTQPYMMYVPPEDYITPPGTYVGFYMSVREISTSGETRNITLQHHRVVINDMPSRVSISLPGPTLVDPDGTDKVSQYRLAVDECTPMPLTGQSLTDGSCTENVCLFYASPNTFSSELSKIRCVGDSYASVRAVLTLVAKPGYLNRCPGYVNGMTVDPLHFDFMPALGIQYQEVVYVQETQPTWTLNYTLYNPHEEVFLAVNESTYQVDVVRKNTRVFNADTIAGCVSPFNFSILNTVMEELVTSIIATNLDVSYLVCIEDEYVPPQALNMSIGNIFEQKGVPFVVPVHDFNDFVQGTDTAAYSASSFRSATVPSTLESSTGVKFFQTEFPNSEIRAANCLGPRLDPLTVYETVSFCYITNGTEFPQFTAYTAIDSSGDESLDGYIVFNGSVQIVSCDATNDPNIRGGCTSFVNESNSMFGDAWVALVPEVDVFPVNTQVELTLVVDSLPSHGRLHTCANETCLLPGDSVSVGDRIVFVPGVPILMYASDPDYFNTVVYQFVGGNDVLEDFISFVDRKNVPFHGCLDGDRGCPDSFRFQIENPNKEGVAERGQYDLFVQNRGSRISISKEPRINSTSTSEPLDVYTSNEPLRVGQHSYAQNWYDESLMMLVTNRWVQNNLIYTDLDGDTWEVELLVVTDLGYVGNISRMSEVYDITMIPIEADCRSENGVELVVDSNEALPLYYCGGTFVLRGLPSDMARMMRRDLWFIHWPTFNGQVTNQEIYLSMSKLYALDKYTTRNYLDVFHRDTTEYIEGTVNECADGTGRPDQNYWEDLHTTLPVFELDPSRVYIHGYHGSSTLLPLPTRFFSDVTDDVVSCTTATFLFDLKKILFDGYGVQYGGSPGNAQVYTKLGPQAVLPVATRRLIRQPEAERYIAYSNVVSFRFNWDENYGSLFPPVTIYKPAPSIGDVLLQILDVILGGAISNPTPAVIALGVIGVFLLVAPIPLAPILRIATAPVRALVKVGGYVSRPAAAALRPAYIASQNLARQASGFVTAGLGKSVFKIVVLRGPKLRVGLRGVKKSSKVTPVGSLRVVSTSSSTKLVRASRSQRLAQLSSRYLAPVLTKSLVPKFVARKVASVQLKIVSLGKSSWGSLGTRVIKPTLKWVGPKVRQPVSRMTSLGRSKLLTVPGKLRSKLRSRNKAKQSARFKNKKLRKQKKDAEKQRRLKRREVEKKKKRLRRQKRLNDKKLSKNRKLRARPRPRKSRSKSKFLPIFRLLGFLAYQMGSLIYGFLALLVWLFKLPDLFDRVLQEVEDNNNEEENNNDDAKTVSTSGGDEENDPLLYSSKSLRDVYD